MLKKPVFFVVCAALAITNLSAAQAQSGFQTSVPSIGSSWQTNQFVHATPATKSALKVQPVSTDSKKTFSKSSSYMLAPVSKKAVPNVITLPPAPPIPQPVVEYTPVIEHAPAIEHAPVMEHTPVIEHTPATYAPAITYAPAAPVRPVCTSGG